MSKISLILATDLNGVIGQDGKLPWHLPHDLKFFKETTQNHPVLMGRKTFESIGKPLPNRTNIVITRKPHLLNRTDIGIVTRLEDGIHLAQQAFGGDEIFIIGGGEIYQLGLEFCHTIYWTKVETEIKGGNLTYGPTLKIPDEYSIIEETKFPADKQNPYTHTIIQLRKNK